MIFYEHKLFEQCLQVCGPHVSQDSRADPDCDYDKYWQRVYDWFRTHGINAMTGNADEQYQAFVGQYWNYCEFKAQREWGRGIK